LQQCAGGVSGELRAVKRGAWKLPQGFGEGFRSDGSRFSGSATGKALGQNGGARNRSRATAAKEARFLDAAVHDSRGELEDIAADGIAYLDRRRGAGQFPRIARIAKVIENSFAEHPRKYPKAALGLQRGTD